MFKIDKYISIYIHFPWCVKKCPYCDFNSHAIKDDLYLSDTYYKKLIEDFDQHLEDIQGREIISIFIGGGTPSLFKAEYLGKVLEHIKTKAKLASNCEITLEVNPGTVERGSIDSYSKIGINRISLGVQSFQDDKLKTLGRIHNSQNVYTTIEEIHKSDINNFNIDIMHGLPQQNLADGLFDLSEAIKMLPSHLSWYQLTIEPNTMFAAHTPSLPNEEILEKIEIQGKELLDSNGFKQYEISAYAKDNKNSIHNTNYWLFGDYIGIGAGAHSKVTNLDKHTVKRVWKHKHPKVYTQTTNFVKGSNILTREDLIYEFMLNALRLKNGFNLNKFTETTFLNIKDIDSKIAQGIKKGILSNENNILKPTDKGYIFLNDCINIFI
ncbi:radical SAM family heme chaperone HemW [Francisella frigiditurris]|uniref:Heme chaperone HemW n=1 Tax=Francisella frigiditurris TaxID=1542390 RepID=A0A1J0KVW2_9GAMM|nr:radical SAM family heme chaperone HemW [Francisella frigiditurris]APC97795.1 radical SAM superfamily protein [Francisella frigiditurris]